MWSSVAFAGADVALVSCADGADCGAQAAANTVIPTRLIRARRSGSGIVAPSRNLDHFGASPFPDALGAVAEPAGLSVSPSPIRGCSRTGLSGSALRRRVPG